VTPVHVAFQVMVGFAARCLWWRPWALALIVRRRDLSRHAGSSARSWFAAPMGFICTEAGWVVTEVGRQPWVIHGVLRTADAVTPMPGLVVPFATFHLAVLLSRPRRRVAAPTARDQESPDLREATPVSVAPGEVV